MKGGRPKSSFKSGKDVSFKNLNEHLRKNIPARENSLMSYVRDMYDPNKVRTSKKEDKSGRAKNEATLNQSISEGE
jgi:hypothetical protein